MVQTDTGQEENTEATPSKFPDNIPDNIFEGSKVFTSPEKYFQYCEFQNIDFVFIQLRQEKIIY